MTSKKAKDPVVLGIPVAEGVRFEYDGATACAVRNESRDIAVRVRQEDHFLRDVLEHIPFVRGIARLFGAFANFFSGLRESGALKPQQAIRGSAFTRRFAALFRTRPQSISALVSALAIPVILGAMVLGLPALVEWLLSLIPGLPRFAVNAVCCMFRVLGSILSVYMICRLRVLNRLCMYRGAAGKVLNAYEAYGSNLTHEEALLSPRLTDRSDGAFLILVMALSIIAFACVRTEGLAAQLLYRAGMILAIAAVLNELIRPLENAGPNGFLASLRAPLTSVQHLFTIEPHNQMIEVAVCAFRAAYESDLPRED